MWQNAVSHDGITDDWLRCVGNSLKSLRCINRNGVHWCWDCWSHSCRSQSYLLGCTKNLLRWLRCQLISQSQCLCSAHVLRRSDQLRLRWNLRHGNDWCRDQLWVALGAYHLWSLVMLMWLSLSYSHWVDNAWNLDCCHSQLCILWHEVVVGCSQLRYLQFISFNTSFQHLMLLVKPTQHRHDIIFTTTLITLLHTVAIRAEPLQATSEHTAAIREASITVTTWVMSLLTRMKQIVVEEWRNRSIYICRTRSVEEPALVFNLLLLNIDVVLTSVVEVVLTDWKLSVHSIMCFIFNWVMKKSKEEILSILSQFSSFSVNLLAIYPRTFVVLKVVTKNYHVIWLGVRIFAVQSTARTANEITTNSSFPVLIEISLHWIAWSHSHGVQCCWHLLRWIIGRCCNDRTNWWIWWISLND